MIPYRAIGIAILAAVLFGAGWQVRTWYDDSRELARNQAIEESRELMRALAGDIATKTEQAIGGIRVENRTIYNEASKEIVRDVIYRDCILPDAGRLLVNQARSGAAAGKLDTTLRNPPATARDSEPGRPADGRH